MCMSIYIQTCWKRNFQVLTGWAATVRPWCDLCERLHKDKSVKIYKNLSNWFSTEADCLSPGSSTIARFVHGESID
ncbi:hypothetical protein SK128_017982 [Halocaridina rubra]|uniref:Uncharacterized protein n=1 Tax=Halocaridina rubra TaxID=373956 RepID=A0AAN8XH26_HALRR